MSDWSRFAVGLWMGLSLVAPAAHAATGTPVPELAAFDTEMEGLLARRQLAGASLAITRNGRLVFARGYGVADPANGAPVQPDSRFRMGLASAAVTSVAAMKLVDQGLLSLDLPALPYLGIGTAADPRADRITLRQLLEGTHGWDSNVIGNPVFRSREIAVAMGVPSPPGAGDVVRWLLRQPLQADPGIRADLSSIGPVLVGAVIEKATGQRLDDAVRTLLLSVGIKGVQQGASLAAGRLPREVVYQQPPGTSSVTSVFDQLPGSVQFAYGGYALESVPGSHGWIASAIDLAALMGSIDGDPGRMELLSPAALTQLMARPSYVSANASGWQAKGWSVQTNGLRFVSGATLGTAARLLMQQDTTTWAVLFNSLGTDTQTLISDIDTSLVRAYGSIKTWPSSDAFAANGVGGTVDGCFGAASLLGTRLCLPAVNVPNGAGGFARYTAILKLTDGPSYTFTLASAAPALDESTDAAVYDPVTGLLTLPRVVLTTPSTAGNVPAQAWRAVLETVPSPAGLAFRLRDAVLLP